MAYLLFPGRHLLTTRFQESYLLSMLERPGSTLPLRGSAHLREPLTDVVFAITSSNQQNSRYNPLPFHLRAIGVDRLARQLREALGVKTWIVGIPHFAPTGRFATHLTHEIAEQTEGAIVLAPDNTAVMVSTPALVALYQQAGFGVLPAELAPAADGDDSTPRFLAPLPIELVQRLAELGASWPGDLALRTALSGAAIGWLRDFPEIVQRITRIFRDPLLTEHGGLTDTRDYTTYARAMDAIIDLKLAEIGPGIVPGKIVDEGCADGALLVRLARQFPDSDLVGIDLATEFIARCLEFQRAGMFGGTFVHFHQRNLLEPIFEPDSIDTTICNSTLHELWSYGEQAKTIAAYLQHKYAQLRRGGRLVVRDVVGFPERDEPILMACNAEDGSNEDPLREFASPRELAAFLGGLSTHARFVRFARDFLAELRAAGRRGPETRVGYEERLVAGKRLFALRFGDAVEFLTKKDYVDNWQSELNEEFAFWSFADWKTALKAAGFRVLENPNAPETGSRAYTSAWRVAHGFEGKVSFFRETPAGLEPVPYPVTNMVLIAEK